MRGQPGHNTQPHARLQPSFQGIDAWITSELNEALVFKLRVSFMSLSDIFDIPSIGVFTTRHWQTSGRLVQELNVCTVLDPVITYGDHWQRIIYFSFLRYLPICISYESSLYVGFFGIWNFVFRHIYANCG